MSIYKPSLLDKFKDFVNGLRSNWDAYEDHVADFESHLAESANKHIHSSGSNDDGYWIRYDDGTQICYSTKYIASHNIGGNGSSIKQQMPQPFISNNVAASYSFVGMGDSNSADANRIYNAFQNAILFTTANNWYIRDGTVVNRLVTDVTINFKAVGRWK